MASDPRPSRALLMILMRCQISRTPFPRALYLAVQIRQAVRMSNLLPSGGCRGYAGRRLAGRGEAPLLATASLRWIATTTGAKGWDWIE